MDYMCTVLNRFKVSDLKEIAKEYFEMSVSSLENEIQKRKIRMNKKNLSQILMLKVKQLNWKISDIVTTAFDLELDYVIKYSNRFLWTANKFVGDSAEEIFHLDDSIRATIRKSKQDASVSVRESDDFFWISISMKNLKKLGIFEKPHYIVLSKDAQYFFTKDNRSASVIKFVTATLGYESEKKKKLTGRSLPTLLKLLIRKDNVDMKNRPVYQAGKAVEKEFGLDFTQKKYFLDFYDKCVDNDTDISLQRYTVTSVNSCWMCDDDDPVLRDMEFKTSITLRGDVPRIIRQLPIASIVKPPVPNYLKNFSVYGRNVVSIKPTLPLYQRETLDHLC